MAAVLIIEDDKTFGRILENFLIRNGFQARVCSKGSEGLALLHKESIDIVLLDYRLPDTTGIELLKHIKQFDSSLPVIIMTGYSDIRTAISAIKMGAHEYITKPVNPEELLLVAKEALQKRSGTEITKRKSSILKRPSVTGTSKASLQLQEYINLVSPTDFTVIIEGESGTGKENVARAIHQQSKRAGQRFLAIDCGALSRELAASELFGHVKGAFTGAVSDKPGKLEEADGGTLFLDEVGNLSYDVQVKLLRTLQERVIQPVGSTRELSINVRIITATNDSLHEKVAAGLFRQDLYHRLNEFKIYVPPLRERLEDLQAFVHFFQQQACEELGRVVLPLSDKFMEVVHHYAWPGNLRELRNVIRRSVLLTTSAPIDCDVLPPEIVSMSTPLAVNENPYDLKALSELRERELIVKTLHEVRYNKSKAARMLNIDRKTLYVKMEKYKIE
jgi:two-component system, NtrC family, response regulator HydG